MGDSSGVKGLRGLLQHAHRLIEASSRSADQQHSDDLDVVLDAISVVAPDVPADAAWQLCTKLLVHVVLCALCMQPAMHRMQAGATV